jgi:hypothetical protein
MFPIIRLGFPLPQLLRDLYLQLANGGFGWQTGFVGVAGGAESAELRSVDHATIHAPWKLIDAVPDGLVNRPDVFKSFSLPDRFIPLCGLDTMDERWIDGWTGHVYGVGVYSPFDDSPSAASEDFEWISTVDVSKLEDDGADQLIKPEDLLSLEETQQGAWEDCDVDVDAVPDATMETWCFGISLEAWSLKAWLEQWLETPIPQSWR